MVSYSQSYQLYGDPESVTEQLPHQTTEPEELSPEALRDEALERSIYELLSHQVPFRQSVHEIFDGMRGRPGPQNLIICATILGGMLNPERFPRVPAR